MLESGQELTGPLHILLSLLMLDGSGKEALYTIPLPHGHPHVDSFSISNDSSSSTHLTILAVA